MFIENADVDATKQLSPAKIWILRPISMENWIKILLTQHGHFGRLSLLKLGTYRIQDDCRFLNNTTE